MASCCLLPKGEACWPISGITVESDAYNANPLWKKPTWVLSGKQRNHIAYVP